MGLAGMISEMVAALRRRPRRRTRRRSLDAIARPRRAHALARAGAADHRARERRSADAKLREALHARRRAAAKAPVLGITGTGGAGKSSLTDELVRRFRLDQDDALQIAVISIDPSRRKSGGALLGDRIRMNAIEPWQRRPTVYMRSLATRDAGSEISARRCPTCIAACKVAGFDLVIVETSGIGQGDAAIVPLVDVPLYVMTPEFGAASQLEKIDMLDFADFVAINKFDRKGAAGRAARRAQAGPAQPRGVRQEARRDAGVRHDGQRASTTTASPRCTRRSLPRLAELGLKLGDGTLPRAYDAPQRRTRCRSCRPRACATWPRSPTPCAATSAARCEQARLARERAAAARRRSACCEANAEHDAPPTATRSMRAGRRARGAARRATRRSCSRMWPQMQQAYAGDEYVVKIRDKEIRTALTTTSLSGTQDPQGRAADVRGPRRAAAVAAAGERARQLPVHRRRVRVQARERGPDAHVRRRRRRVPHQHALQAARRRHAGQAAVDRVRLGHAVRQRPATCGPTSTARSATRACRSPRSTT